MLRGILGTKSRLRTLPQIVAEVVEGAGRIEYIPEDIRKLGVRYGLGCTDLCRLGPSWIITGWGLRMLHSKLHTQGLDLGHLSSSVDDSQLEGLRAHFTQFDVDNSGYIDSHELTGVLRSMGFNPTDKRVAEVLSAYDTDRNGNLSFGEFVEVWAYYCQEAKNEGELISRSFTFFLPTDCQSMSYSDFKEIMMEIGDALSPEEVDRFFALVDDESDGILRLDEFMKVLYSDQTDLTKLSDGLDKDDVDRLFNKSSRPQRRSLMMSRTMNGYKGQSLSNFKFASLIPTSGVGWAQKSSTGSCLGSAIDCSPSKDQSKGNIHHRRLRYSRYNRCRSVHVESSSAAQSGRSSRGQDRNSSPVRYLRSDTSGPWCPAALSATSDECSIEPLVEGAQGPQQEAPSQNGLGEQAAVEHTGTEPAARATWCAPSAAVVVRDHVPAAARRKSVGDIADDENQVWTVDGHVDGDGDPTPQMKYNILFDASTVCGEGSEDEATCDRVSNCVGEQDQSRATCSTRTDSVQSEEDHVANVI